MAVEKLPTRPTCVCNTGGQLFISSGEIFRITQYSELPRLTLPVSAPGGSVNEYARFIIEEDIDSLLLETSQVFEHVAKCGRK